MEKHDGHDFDSTIDPSEREFGPSGISLSKYRFPTGWFIVGFASELDTARSSAPITSAKNW